MSLFEPTTSLFELPPAEPAPAVAVTGAPAVARPKPSLSLRPYQELARASILAAFDHHQSVLAVSATGTGKTVLFAHLIKSVLERHADGYVLVLAHRDELIQQAADKIHSVTGVRPMIEMGDEWANLTRLPWVRVVVSSVQTQIAGLEGRGRMVRFPPNCRLAIVDEAHRSVAPSYLRVKRFHSENSPGLRWLGVTATPDRGDQQALGKVFEAVAFKFPIYDAINEGWLVPIRQRSVKVTGLDLSKVRTTAGDLNGADLDRVLRFEETLHQMATPVLELARGRQTLIFCASVAHAERFAEILNRHQAGSARCVSGETPRDERREIFRDFGKRRFQCLCNVGVATEGTDVPGIEVVVLARPTKSRALFEQMVGRGTRPLPGTVDGPETAEGRRAAVAASAKPYLEVIDFVGNAGKHKLVTVADVLGGSHSEEVRARAAKKSKAADKKGVPADVMEMLRLAESEIDAEKRRQAEAEERERAARKHITAQATYRVNEIDPFDFYDVRPPREVHFDKLARPTPGQLEFLEKRGIDATKTTRGEAGRLIQELKGRITPGQAKVLRRAGYDVSEVRGLAQSDASRLIERVKENGWKRVAADGSAPRASAPAPAAAPALTEVEF